MFYAHFVLAKKGPLAKIWLAAHWDKKLTKAHVFETNIEKSVDGILKPKVKMALRTSGHLLLGVVRIYSRKAKYLLQDCNEAFVKIKMAFRPGMVDLPEEHREAAMNAITLPEVFHDFDTAMPELNEVDIEAQFSLNQSRAEEITMREDYGSLNLVAPDDGFGDMGFDTDNPDIMRDAMGSGAGLEQSNLLFADGSSLELGGKDQMPSTSGVSGLVGLSHERRMEAAPHPQIDLALSNTIADVPDFGPAGGLFEGDLFGDVTGSSATTSQGVGLPPTDPQPQSLQAEIDAAGTAGADSDDDMQDHYDVPTSPAHSWGASPPHSGGLDDVPLVDDAAVLMPPPSVPHPALMEVDDLPGIPDQPDEPLEQAASPQQALLDNTTLLQNDEESFALAPVDATVLKGIPKAKRKRKLIVDEVKNISGEEMKNQLSNTSDIVTTLDLAPPTRRLMHWKETGGVEKLFTLPARPIPSRVLFKNYQRNMNIRNEADEAEARSPQPLEQPRKTRKRRLDESLPPETPAPMSLLDLEPPTPVPQEYEPSIGPDAPATPGYPLTPRSDDMEPHTPGGLMSTLGAPMTPGSLLQGGFTPAGLHHGSMTPDHHNDDDIHGGMTPAGLQHGGMTPAGLQHGGMTPGLGLDGSMTPGGLVPGGLTSADLQRGGLTPGGLDHGGMTPGDLHHGGMTPAGLHHGGLTPVGLHHGGMTPAGLHHGGMTPAGLHHGGMTPVGLHHGGMTPAGLHHGMPMTPAGLHQSALLHGLDQQSPVMPQMGSDRVLRSSGTHQPGHMPMEPLLHGIEDHADYRDGMQMTNLGYDDHHHGHVSPQHDYDLPPSVENAEEGEREADETDEQFEERVLNRRAAQLFQAMKPKLSSGDAIMFNDLAPRHNNRKQVAQKFYSLLVLKKYQVLTLEQDNTYGPITISRGSQFETEAI